MFSFIQSQNKNLKIFKAGIQDTVQDMGRYGYQHLGINPGGAMDKFSAQMVNMLAGNEINQAVIELHFPASVFIFQQPALIALGGADFSPSINGEKIPSGHPVLVNKNSILQFHKIIRQGTTPAFIFLKFKIYIFLKG